MGILNKIKEKPENHKRVISIVSAGLLTLIIIYFFLYIPNKNLNIDKPETKNLSAISPIQAFKSQITDLFLNNTEDEEASSTTIIIETIDFEENDSTTTGESFEISETSIESEVNEEEIN